jgi:type I restriction enzyme S subunit
MSFYKKRIGDCCEVGDGTHASLQRTEAGVPYLTAKNLKDGSIAAEKIDFIAEATFEKHFKLESKVIGRPKPGDVIFGIIGSLGQAYLVKSGDRIGISSSVAVLRPNAETLLPSFLYYWVTGPTFQSALYSIKGGVAQSYISLEMIRSLPLPVPTLTTQRRIASILSPYDRLIQNNRRRIVILEEMVRRIYEEWFVRFRFPGHEQLKMVESGVGLLPEGWNWGSLRDIAFDVRDAVNPELTDPATPYVGLEHIPRRSIGLTEWGSAADVQSTKLRFNSGDILFGKIRPYFHKVAVAPIAGVTSTDAIVIRAREKDWFPLILSTVFSDAFVAEATQSSNGTKMPRANWNVLLGYKVPLPTPEVRDQFNALMNGVTRLIKNATLQNRNLRKTRDLLLPKLISGDLDVSTVPELDAIAA